MERKERIQELRDEAVALLATAVADGDFDSARQLLANIEECAEMLKQEKTDGA